MNTYRFAALALATCAASLSATACSAGISTAGSSATNPATSSTATSGSGTSGSGTSGSGSSSHSASAAASSPSPSSSGRMITVNGTVGSFPVPAGAKVVETGGTSQDSAVIFEYVTPAKVSSFYATALPQAGYTISTNSVISQIGGTAAIVEFTGHGFKGYIDALSNYPDTGVTIAGLGRKNVTTVTFMPQ